MKPDEEAVAITIREVDFHDAGTFVNRSLIIPSHKSGSGSAI